MVPALDYKPSFNWGHIALHVIPSVTIFIFKVKESVSRWSVGGGSWWRITIMAGQLWRRCWSGGAQQPDHTLVNLLENRRHIPGRGRGNERGKDGMYPSVGPTRIFQRSFLTCALVPGEPQTLWEPVVPYVELIPVLEPVLSDSLENSCHSPAIASKFLKVWNYWHPDIVPISWKELKFNLFPERRVPELNIPLTHRAPVEKQLWRFGWRQKSEATQ